MEANIKFTTFISYFVAIIDVELMVPIFLLYEPERSGLVHHKPYEYSCRIRPVQHGSCPRAL